MPKIACIILDALGPYSLRQTGLEYVESLYENRPRCRRCGDPFANAGGRGNHERSCTAGPWVDRPDVNAGLMGISSLAHTPISNQMLWSGAVDYEHVWIQKHPYQWTGGIGEFDPMWKRQSQLDDAVEVWTREDLRTNFIWDVLDHHGYDAAALGTPITLPPYSFRADYQLHDAWFPHTPTQLRDHVRLKPRFIQHHALRGDDFICCSIKVPDQWLHAQGSDIIDADFVAEESTAFETRFKATIETLEAQGYDWLIFGDHGAPGGGRAAHHETKDLFFNHRKEAIIIGTIDDLPRYSDEMYPRLLEYFGVEDVDELLDWPPNQEPEEHPPMDDILERVEKRVAGQPTGVMTE